MTQNKTFSDTNRKKLSPAELTKGYSKEFATGQKKVISDGKSDMQDIIKSKESGKYIDNCK